MEGGGVGGRRGFLWDQIPNLATRVPDRSVFPTVCEAGPRDVTDAAVAVVAVAGGGGGGGGGCCCCCCAARGMGGSVSLSGEQHAV